MRVWAFGAMVAAACSVLAQPGRNVARAEPDFIVQTWGTSEGLPANVVLSLAQTPDGYLWLGTTHGLVCFDGVRFESYVNARMPHRFGTRVEELDVDTTGRLWVVAEQKGLLAVTSHQVTEFHTNGLVLSNATASVCGDSKGGIWVSDTRGNLARMSALDPKQLEPVDFALSPAARLVRDGHGTIWATAPRNVCGRFAGSWKMVLRPHYDIQAAGGSKEGGLWLATDGQLQRLATNGTAASVDAFPWAAGETSVTCLFEDGEQTIWIGTSSLGLFRWDGKRVSQVLAAPRAVNCLAQDTEGNLWVGTRGAGLARLRKRVFRTLDSAAGLRNEYINALTEDTAGRIWLATEENGLGWMTEGRWHPLDREPGWARRNVFSVTAAREQGIWLATAGQGLWRWQSNSFTRINLDSRLPAGPPRCLHEGQDGTLWLVLDDVAVFSISGGAFQRHGPRVGLNTRRVRSLVEDSEGAIWAGDWRGGLWRFAGGRWEELRPPTSNTDAVRTMVVDKAGQLWVGTAAAGLLRLRGTQVARVGTLQGLPDEDVEQMLLNDDKLWLGTPKGLFHVSLAELNDVADRRRLQVSAIRHGQGEGLPELHFTGRLQPRSWRTRDGELWFATANGAVHFRPSELAPDGPPPRTLIEEVRVNSHASPPQSPQRLRSDARRLEFRFTAPSFTAPERVRFRCKLEGVDEDWVECGTDRTATYASVPFGTHVFHVAACNAAGVWGPAAQSAPLVVLPYFWQTRWFAAAVAAGVAGGLVWGARRATLLRLSRRLKLVEQQHALERERARISQDIHDELGANLTTIGLLADMGNRHKSSPQALARDLGQISETARDTAAAMDAIVWALNPRNDSLDHFANYVGQFAKDFFRPTEIRTRLDFPANLPARPMSANLRHNLFLAVKEALNNVVRHAEASEIRLSLQDRRGALLLTVEDNGKGLPITPPTDGQDGLASIRARIENAGGHFAIHSTPGAGTRLDFTVPLTESQT